MGNRRRDRETSFKEPVRGAGRDRLEEKRRRFESDRNGSEARRGLRPATFITIGVIALAVVFVGFSVFRASGTQASTTGAAPAAAAGTIQQVATSAATVENGKVSIPVDEVKTKKIVYWDYTENGKKVPLMAYVTPSGAMKIAVRICEPCNGFAFHIEGNQIVCNSCGTRWDLETSKGISGGCQGYPPDVLQASVDGDKVSVDETLVTSWKARA